jgi:hypothetical protein
MLVSYQHRRRKNSMNFYHYIYYIHVKFVKEFMGWQPRPNSAARIQLDLLVTLNVFTFSLLLKIYGILSATDVLILMLPELVVVSIVNQYLLLRNKRSELIIKYYDEKYAHTGQNGWRVSLVVLYFLLTWILFFISVFVFRKSV